MLFKRVHIWSVFQCRRGETFATFYLGYYTLTQSSFDVDDAFTSCLISFSRRRVTTQNFRIAFEKKEKRREALATPLPLSRRGSLSLEWSQSLCLSVCRLGEREREKERNFWPPNNESEIIHKKNEYIKNNDDDKRAPMPAKRRRGCKQQTSTREQRQMQQQ